MMQVIITHRVEDFERWLPHFRDHHATRARYGCEDEEVYRSEEDPSEVVVSMRWKDREGLARFLEESDLREVMARAGVVGEPDVEILSGPVAWDR